MKYETTMPLRLAYPFGEEHGLAKEIADIRDMTIEWDRSYTSSLRRGFIVALFEQKGIWGEFCAKHWSIAEGSWAQARVGFWRRLKREYEEFLEGNGSDEKGENESEEIEAEVGDERFAAENDLRDFLANNPGRIEPGLKVYNKDGVRGVEFAVDNGAGRIDLLLIDAMGELVVVELKVSRGRNKTLGQLLYYMGWVDQHLAKKPCRGIIVAKEITEDLLTAVRRVPGVSLMRYHMSVTLEQVGEQPGG